MRNSNYSDWYSGDSRDDYDNWNGYGDYGDGNEGCSYNYGDPEESKFDAYSKWYENWGDEPDEYYPEGDNGEFLLDDDDDDCDNDNDYSDDEYDIDEDDEDDDENDCGAACSFDAFEEELFGMTLEEKEIEFYEDTGLELPPELKQVKKQIKAIEETPVQIGDIPTDTRPFAGEPGFFADLNRIRLGNLTPKKALEKYIFSILREHYLTKNGNVSLEAEKTALQITDFALDIDKDAEIRFTSYDEDDTVMCLKITMNLYNSRDRDIMFGQFGMASFCKVRRVVCSRFELCGMFRNYWKEIR